MTNSTRRFNLNGEEITASSTNETDAILAKIKDIFLTMGFKPIGVRDSRDEIFALDNLHCIPQYGWAGIDGFFVEYADNLREAQNNMYEDGDVFPLKMGEDAILEGIRNELLKETQANTPLSRVI